MIKGNVVSLEWVNRSSKTWERSMMAYKFNIQYDKKETLSRTLVTT